MLLPVDLQLDGWKEFEEQVPVIMLLIVDNTFCIMAQSYKAWCFSGNPSVKQCQENEKQHPEFSSKGFSSCGHLQRNRWTKAVGYFWNSFSKLQRLHFHKIPAREFSLNLRWLWCRSKRMSTVKKLSRSSRCLVEKGTEQRTCSGRHIVTHFATWEHVL